MSNDLDLSSLRIDRSSPPPRKGPSPVLIAILVVAIAVVGFLVVRSRQNAARLVELGTAEATGGGSASICRPPWLDTTMPSAPSATAFSASSGCSSPFSTSGFFQRSR